MGFPLLFWAYADEPDVPIEGGLVITTEAGDDIQTEGGDDIVTEPDPE